jgi:predicted nucleic acid-binding protein
VTKLAALLDACVIFPYTLADTLLRAAEQGLYRVYFSVQILDEATRNRVQRGTMSETGADRFQTILCNAFPEAIVPATSALENVLTNHPKDRHVLASAIQAKADVIVTSNLKDFSTVALAPWNIGAISPDDFLIGLCDEYGDDVLYQLIAAQAASYKKSFDRNRPDKQPPVTDRELISVFAKEQPLFARRMLDYRGEIL